MDFILGQALPSSRSSITASCLPAAELSFSTGSRAGPCLAFMARRTQYMLGSEEQWSLNRSLNYYVISQLQVFCKKAGKREKITCKGLPWWLSIEESACSAGATGDLGSIPGLGRSPGRGCGNTLQYCCLENPMDRGAWGAAGHGVTQSRPSCSELARVHHVQRPSCYCIRGKGGQRTAVQHRDLRGNPAG